MYTDCEGIILRQVKTAYGRRMIVILTDKYGKISAGTSISEKGKNKPSLALRPFTRGRYELYKSRDSFNINGAETLESFFEIGEDIDKFMAASYVLELTDRMIEEDQTIKPMYDLLGEFLRILAKRKASYTTPVIAYQIKSMKILGLTLSQNPLIESESSDKINIIKYIEDNPLTVLEGIALEKSMEQFFSAFMKTYISENLGIESLKSEGLMI